MANYNNKNKKDTFIKLSEEIKALNIISETEKRKMLEPYYITMPLFIYETKW